MARILGRILPFTYDKDSTISAPAPATQTATAHGLGQSKATQVSNRSVTARRRVRSLHAMIRIASVCLAAYWLTIFVLTHLPQASLPHLGWSDKVYHAMAFSGLSFLLAWALPISNRVFHIFVVALTCIVYACLDEYTQQFVAGRTADFWDATADLGGVLIGICVYTLCRQILVSLTWGRRIIQLLSR